MDAGRRTPRVVGRGTSPAARSPPESRNPLLSDRGSAPRAPDALLAVGATPHARPRSAHAPTSAAQRRVLAARPGAAAGGRCTGGGRRRTLATLRGMAATREGAADGTRDSIRGVAAGGKWAGAGSGTGRKLGASDAAAGQHVQHRRVHLLSGR